jgi:hypothetical protein
VAAHDDEWELAMVWRDPAKGSDDVAVHTVRGLTERELCRLFGLRGETVPVWPVPVHDHELRLLEPYVAESLSLPEGTTGELRPIDGVPAPAPTRLWLPVVWAIVGGVLGGVLWHLGGTASGWQQSLLKGAAGLLILLAFWSVGLLLLLLVMGILAVNRNRKTAAVDDTDGERTADQFDDD